MMIDDVNCNVNWLVEVVVPPIIPIDRPSSVHFALMSTNL
jgi:hypothetical protein